MKFAKKRLVLLVVGLVVVLSACGSSTERLSLGAPDAATSEVGQVGAQTVDDAQARGADAKPRADGLVPGEPVPVISRNDETGFVKWDDMFPAPGRAVPNVAPVVDERGTVIAYWGDRIGWISKADHDDPGFTYDKALAKVQGEIAALAQSDSG